MNELTKAMLGRGLRQYRGVFLTVISDIEDKWRVSFDHPSDDAVCETDDFPTVDEAIADAKQMIDEKIDNPPENYEDE